MEYRSRPWRRFHPYPAALPLDGFLAECKAESVPGVLSTVQALERSEYPISEFSVYARAVVFDGEYEVEIHRLG